jgi:hypothetical protein
MKVITMLPLLDRKDLAVRRVRLKRMVLPLKHMWRFRVPLVLCVAMLIIGCDRPTYTYRYRLTIEVEVNGETRAGTSVVEVSESVPFSLERGKVVTVVRGEGTVVDLDGGKVLIAFLEGVPEEALQDGEVGRKWIGKGPTGMLAQMYQLSSRWQDARNDALAKLAKQREVKELSPNQLPTLVSFKNAHDPKTVFVVKPQAFHEAFGPGIRLKRATIAVTDEPQTTGIERTLPWLKTIDNLSGERYCGHAQLSRELPFCPNRLHFIRKGV